MASECFRNSEILEYQIYTYDGFLNKPLGKTLANRKILKPALLVCER